MMLLKQYLTQFIVLLLLVQLKFTMAQDYDVIIVGAGMSGLGAALELHEKNHTNFLVLEAKDDIGGRVKSTVFNETTLSLGAGWIHAATDGHSYYELAKKYNMTLTNDDSELWENVMRDGENGTRYSKDLVKTKLEDLMTTLEKMDEIIEARLEAGRGEPDLETGLRMAGWHGNTLFDQTIEMVLFDFENGIESNAISGVAYSYTGYGDGSEYIVTDSRGYLYPIRREIAPFDKKIIRNTPVTKVKKFNSHYEVTTKNNTVVTSKHVLISVSSGVLLNEVINFEPGLPAWKTESLAFCPMASYCRIVLQFTEQFWDDTMYFYTTGKINGYYFHWQNLNLMFPGKNMLLATLTGQKCKESERENDEVIKQQAFDVLKKIYPNATFPTALVRHKWTVDPYVLGSYSYRTAGITEDDYVAISHPIKQSLWFTGEYANVDEYDYTHGAYDHGRLTASKIIECMNGKCPTDLPKRTKKCPNVSNGLGLKSNLFGILMVMMLNFVYI